MGIQVNQTMAGVKNYQTSVPGYKWRQFRNTSAKHMQLCLKVQILWGFLNEKGNTMPVRKGMGE